MSGRPKKKVHEYDLNGKFIRTFQSQSDFRKVFYWDDLGRRALFQEKDYIIEFDRVFVLEKIGRDAVKRLIKRDKNVFVRLGNDPKEIEVLNMDNVVVATFASIKIAGDMTKIPSSTIYHAVVNEFKHGKEGLMFRYKK